MKKPSGVTLAPPPPKPNSLISSHQNEEFIASSSRNTLRFKDQEDAENVIIENGEEEEEDDGDDDDDDDYVADYDEEDDEGDDEYEVDEGEEEAEQDDEGNERDRGNDAMAITTTATATMEQKKLGSRLFEVEFICKKRICKGEQQYLIKWRGWPESENTWEPANHLLTCPDAVEAFEESLRSGKKKVSHKQKEKFTQQKKKVQYSYRASKKHDNHRAKRPRTAKIIEGTSSETISPHVPNNEKESGEPLYGQTASGKILDICLQQPRTVEGDAPENFQSNAAAVKQGESNERRGAKRRKSGSVRRFTQDMTSFSFDYLANASPINISPCDRVEEMLGNSNGSCKKKFDSSGSSTVITRIIKPIRYSASVTNNDVSVTFAALRSDGQEVTVDNKFLKENNPNLLFDFYEKHLRYDPN